MKKKYRFVEKFYVGDYHEWETQKWSFPFGWEAVTFSQSSNKEEARRRFTLILSGAPMQTKKVLEVHE